LKKPPKWPFPNGLKDGLSNNLRKLRAVGGS